MKIFTKAKQCFQIEHALYSHLLFCETYTCKLVFKWDEDHKGKAFSNGSQSCKCVACQSEKFTKEALHLISPKTHELWFV